MKNTLETLRAYAIPAVAMTALSFGAAGASAQDAEVLKLDIEPQQAGPALMELASSSGVQIMLPDQAGADVEVKGLRGEYKLEEALAALLTDTGLAYEFTSENVVLVQQSQQSEELQEVEAADDSAATEDEDEPIELEKQVVTGSRLEGGDPSARIYSYTAEDIAVRGVSTLEDFFRTLPWTYPSITTQTNTSLHYQGSDQEDEYIELGLGISTVNLRNMGSANTLVLLNGRRVAGTGEEDDFANILTIPLSAIERVDIQLDGASAVYGSDAIGGVVNFVTKRNYKGLAIDYRNEFSSTDADQTKASVTGGYAWGSGNVTAILSRDTSDPITNNKTGLTTLDFRPLLGPEFDLRSTSSGQPGVACEYSPVFASQPATIRCKRRTPKYQLPADHSGLGATVDDFIVIESGETLPYPYDEIDPQNGAESSTDSFTVSFEQYLTDNLRVYADLLYSRHESYQEFSRKIQGFIPIPTSNAYNPFGKPMAVQYAPIREFEQGLLPTQFTESETRQRNVNFGVIWEFGSHELNAEVTRTKSERETYRVRAKARRPRWDPTADAYYAALTSSDPNRAINVFGNGEAQGSAFEELLTVAEGPINGDSETRAYNLTVRGSVFNLWGGPVFYSVGTEYRKNTIYRTQETTVNLAGIDLQQLVDSGTSIGVDRPSREITAYYAELALPLIGPENSRPGVHSLILSLQARRDENESTARPTWERAGRTSVTRDWTRAASLLASGIGLADLQPEPRDPPLRGCGARCQSHYDQTGPNQPKHRCAVSAGGNDHLPHPVVAFLPPARMERPVRRLH